MPRVFISYSHDSDTHRDRVLALADRLRADGIESLLDQYVAHPTEGWPSWAQQQITDADFTILVCTPTYNRRFEGKETDAKETTWEAWIIKQNLYEARGRNSKMIPVVFEEHTASDVPLVLRPFTSYLLPSGYDDLYRHLTAQPRSPAPPVGPRRTLSPARRSGPQPTSDVDDVGDGDDPGEPLPRAGRPRWPWLAGGVAALAITVWWWPFGGGPEASRAQLVADPVDAMESTDDQGSGESTSQPEDSKPEVETRPRPKEPGAGPQKGSSPPKLEPLPFSMGESVSRDDSRRWKVLSAQPAGRLGMRLELDRAAPVEAVLTLSTYCEHSTTRTALPQCVVAKGSNNRGLAGHCFTRDDIRKDAMLCIQPRATKAGSR